MLSIQKRTRFLTGVYMILYIFTFKVFCSNDCHKEIKLENISIQPVNNTAPCSYNLTLNNIGNYSRKLNSIPPFSIIKALSKNVHLYRKIIVKYNNYITNFYNLLKEGKERELYLYLGSTIKNKKDEGVKILIGLFLSTSSDKYSYKILEQFISEYVFKEINNSSKLKRLLFPLLSVELYTGNTLKRRTTLIIFSNLQIPTTFFCQHYKNLSYEEINLCFSNINIQDTGWVKSIFFNKEIPYSIKAVAVSAASKKNIDAFDKIFIEYARSELLDKKTDKDAVELCRLILAYLGEHPSIAGLQFASEVTLNKEIPFVLRHEAITSLDKMRVFSNETFFTFVKVLKDENNNLRAHAANFLGNLLLSDALPYLKESVKNDPYNITRAYALEAVGKIGQKKENNFIIQFLKDNSSLVRLVAIQWLLKNHYSYINLSPVVRFLASDPPVFLPEDQMAKMVAFEILQEFAPPDISLLLIEKLKNEQNINIIFLINDTLNRIYSMGYTLNYNFDEIARENMISFWKRIYNINKKNIFNRVALDVSALKKSTSLVRKKCHKSNICTFTVKPLFKSYSNKFYKKIKNFTSYNVKIFIGGKKVMEQQLDKKAWDFTLKFHYPQHEKVNLTMIMRIDDRIFKQSILLK